MKRLAAYAAIKLTRYLESRKGDEYFEKYAFLLDRETTAEVWELLSDEPDVLYGDAQTERELLAKTQYEWLYELFEGNALAMTALQLAVYAYMDKTVLEIYGDICPEGRKGATMELAAKLVFGESEALSRYPECRAAWEYIKYLFPASDGGQDFFHEPFLADARLIGYLSGLTDPDSRLEMLAEHFSPWEDALEKRYPVEKQTEEAFRYVKKRCEERQYAFCLHIHGDARSGRRFLAKHMAAENGLTLFLVDYAKLMTMKSPALLWRLVLREILLGGDCLCLYHISCTEETRGTAVKSLQNIEREYEVMGMPLFLLTDGNVKLIPFLKQEIVELPLRPYDSEQSRMLWEAFLKEYGLEQRISSRELAAKMNLPAGQMRQVAAMTAKRMERGIYRENDIYRICYQVLDDGRYENIKRVDIQYDWDDLKVDARQKEVLKRICSQVEYRTTVLDDWNLRKNYQYGRGISAIFTGPPGTGKTMAANIIAGKLGLEIFKVDLSQIVDKYIGETEKRLEEVFVRAEKSHMVLFFDEADSILGKRSEVKESKDKYANTEVSYLLQRMEEYDGIVLMATNNRSNIDPAFIRRFRFEVSFHMPSREQRREIWEMLLTDQVPHEDIETDFLADVFEISGAEIKNILLNACFDAAGAGGVLTMERIIMAAYNELKKNGRVLLAGDLKQYGVLLAGADRI